MAAALGVALVLPDTSPRGLKVEGEAESWDLGVGAGFYVNATQPKWLAWRMYDYVLDELPALLAAQFPNLDCGRASIMGHSMGGALVAATRRHAARSLTCRRGAGHGALVLALRNPQRFRSVSAFAPICNPTAVPWGEKAFSGYLGDDREAWKARAHEAVAVLQHACC